MIPYCGKISRLHGLGNLEKKWEWREGKGMEMEKILKGSYCEVICYGCRERWSEQNLVD
jgi:hypothetical protein